MLGTNPKFDEYARRTAGEWTFVVSIATTDGLYWMADRAITDSSFSFPVMDLLVGDVSISEKVDIFARTWADAEASVTINNAPRFRSSASSDSGMLLRPSDKFGNIQGAALAVYLWLGPVGGQGATIFSGTVSEFPEIGADVMVVVATAEHSELKKKVPTTIIDRASYPTAPESSIGRALPRPYGVFSEEAFLDHGGLVPCEQISTNEWRVSDGIEGVKSIDAVWVYSDGLGMWVKLYSDYTALAGTGRVLLDVVMPKAYAYIYPDSGFVDTTWSPGIPSSIIDRRGLYGVPNGYQTYHSMTTGEDKWFAGGVSNTSAIMLTWTRTFEKDDEVGLKWTNIGWIIPQDSMTWNVDDDKVAFEYQFKLNSGYTIASGHTLRFSPAYDHLDSTPEWTEWWNTARTGQQYVVDAATSNWKSAYLSYQELGNPQFNWDEYIKWHLGDGDIGNAAYGHPIAVGFMFQVAQTVADGTEVGKLYQARLRIPFRVKLGTFGGPLYRQQLWNDNIRMAVEVSGIKYRSTIIGGFRNNYNGYTTSDVNTSPPFIVEDILRYVGITTIDTDSFDDADKNRPYMGNSAWYCLRVPVIYDGIVKETQDGRPTAKDMIVDILRQTPYAMTINAVGKARMLDMTGNIQMTNPSIATQISFHDIDLESFMIGKTRIDLVKNKVIVEYMRRPHDGKLSFYNLAEDTTSQADYDEREERLSCDYIGGSGEPTADYLTAYHFRKWLVDKSSPYLSHGYFLSRPKCIVGMFLPGCKWMHLELGDYIQIDATMDKHFKLFGESWGAWPTRMFMIDGIVKTSSGVKVSAIESLTPQD